VNRSGRKSRRGFTFIEVLLALFLVVTSATIVLATMPLSTSARLKADLNNRATSLAQKQLEAIRGRGYANATASQLVSAGLIDSATEVSTNTYAFTNNDSAVLDNPSKVLPAGVGVVKVEQVDLDLRRVTVTVSWTDRGKAFSITIGTLIANL